MEAIVSKLKAKLNTQRQKCTSQKTDKLLLLKK